MYSKYTIAHGFNRGRTIWETNDTFPTVKTVGDNCSDVKFCKYIFCSVLKS